MKKLKLIFISLFLLSITFTSFAEEAKDNWKHYKEIKHNNKNMYKFFFLDEEVYKYSKNDLSDIRIINEKNEFIPYYIYNKYLHDSKELLIEYQSKQIHSHIDKEENKKYIDFKIISEDKNIDILGNKIILNIDKSNFFKKIEVYGSYDNIKWDLLKTDEVYRINEIDKLDIQLNNVFKYSYYRVVFLDEIENTVIDNLKLIYNNKEITYDEYTIIKTADYQMEKDDKEKNTIIYLNNENNLRIKDIEITSNDDFKRRYYIYYKNEDQDEFKQIGSGELYQIALKSFKARKTNIDLERYQDYQFSPKIIKIVINNKDNSPINIDDIKISYLVDKIVFKGDDSNKYTILFGNNDVHKPSYDIEAYKEHIENEDQEVCQLSSIAQQNIAQKKPVKEINYHLILNITIVVISILLVVIIMRKVKF